MSRGREVLVGLVIIVSMAVAVVGTLWLKGTNWGRPSVPLQILVTDVAQLSPGNPVKFRGVQVGRVETIEVEPSGEAVRVTVYLESSIPLPPDAAVLLAPESFFGDWQAEIVRAARFPGFAFFPVPAGTIADGVPVLGGYALPELSRLTASAEQISGNLANLTERFDIAFNEQTAANLAQAIENFGVVSEDLRALIDQQSSIALSITNSADSALAEIETASRVARRSFERIDALLGNAEIDSIVTNVAGASGNLNQIAGDLAGSGEHLAATLARADSVFARIDDLTARISAGEGALGRLVSDTTLAIRAESVLEQLDLLLLDLRENPRRYVRLSIF